MNGLFSVQGMQNFIQVFKSINRAATYCHRSGYTPIEDEGLIKHKVEGGRHAVWFVLVQATGVLLQLAGITLACVFVRMGVLDATQPMVTIIMIAVLVSTILLSITWTGMIQQLFIKPKLNSSKETSAQQTNARWKASKFLTITTITMIKLTCINHNVFFKLQISFRPV